MKRRELTDEERGDANRLKNAWVAYKHRNPGATQTWLAAEAGLGTQGAVGQYLRGAIPLNVDALMALCKVMGADPMTISPRLTRVVADLLPQFAHGEGYDRPVPLGQYRRILATDEEDDIDIQIPKVYLRLSAGITGFRVEPDTSDFGWVTLNRRWIERRGYQARDLVAINVKGESMEPALHEDDIVVINTADTKPVDGIVFAVNYEGEAVIKRLSRDAGEWWLTSDNPDQRKYHRKLCRSGECIIVGRIVKVEKERI